MIDLSLERRDTHADATRPASEAGPIPTGDERRTRWPFTTSRQKRRHSACGRADNRVNNLLIRWLIRFERRKKALPFAAPRHISISGRRKCGAERLSR